MTGLDFGDISKIKIPQQGHWATQDQFLKIETAVGPNRLAATQYDPVWAQQAWDRTLRFFGKHLG